MNNAIVIRIIEGIRNLLVPKSNKQNIEIINPVKAGRCCFDFSSCSTRMMTNNAVIAKSIPVVSKGIIFPST